MTSLWYINKAYTPVSDQNSYYIDSKLYNIFDTRVAFDPIKCQNRVSVQEFHLLHGFIKDRFSNKLQTSKILNIITMLLFFIVIFAWIQFLFYFKAFGIYLFIAIFMTLLAAGSLCLAKHVRNKTTNDIQEYLDQMNNIKYNNVSVNWVIEPRWGRFLLLEIKNYQDYQPPISYIA